MTVGKRPTDITKYNPVANESIAQTINKARSLSDRDDFKQLWDDSFWGNLFSGQPMPASDMNKLEQALTVNNAVAQYVQRARSDRRFVEYDPDSILEFVVLPNAIVEETADAKGSTYFKLRLDRKGMEQSWKSYRAGIRHDAGVKKAVENPNRVVKIQDPDTKATKTVRYSDLEKYGIPEEWIIE